ncbi:hypothetical protein SAMN06265376_106189 [Dokdonia pacifica]|uniref:Uncharacterized protein n=2 Tax=Dokdonia pacifica TaxID=1627892 RepID=A0A239BJG2_9FLAO|nr:hypothetical protein SAMN06265376_106189 [Dokdonia pacifica]
MLIGNIKSSIQKEDAQKVLRYRSDLQECFNNLLAQQIPRRQQLEISRLCVEINKTLASAYNYIETYSNNLYQNKDSDIFRSIDCIIDDTKGIKKSLERGHMVMAEIYLDDYIKHSQRLITNHRDDICITMQFKTELGEANFNMFMEYLDHVSAIELMKA